MDDLSGHPFIGLNSRGPLGKALSGYLEAADAELDVVAWTETYHVARALVVAGTGITIADEITARSPIGGDVVMLPLEPALTFDISLMQRAEAPLSLGTRRFTKHLGNVVKTMLPQG